MVGTFRRPRYGRATRRASLGVARETRREEPKASQVPRAAFSRCSRASRDWGCLSRTAPRRSEGHVMQTDKLLRCITVDDEALEGSRCELCAAGSSTRHDRAEGGLSIGSEINTHGVEISTAGTAGIDRTAGPEARLEESKSRSCERQGLDAFAQA